MDTDFDELKILFARKQSSVTSWQKKSNASLQGLSALKTGYIKSILLFIAIALVIIVTDNLSAKKISTSSFGFWILLVCCLYSVLSKAYLLYRLNLIKLTQPVLQAIMRLEHFKKLNMYITIHGELLYIIALSVGVYMYMQPLVPILEKEYPYLMPIILSVFLLWVSIHTWIIKRRVLRRELQILENYSQLLSSEN